MELEKLRKVLKDTRNEFHADKRLVAVGAWKEIPNERCPLLNALCFYYRRCKQF